MFDIQEELKRLPQESGVYLMYNDHDEIIYVGKAINLRNRVRSYFRQSTQNKVPKIKQMAQQIKRFEYIVTDTEVEALILEANLIKSNKPRYNILLKDDKSYPYIKISTEESFPMVFATRIYEKNKGKYFGPYTSKFAVNETVELIHKIWPLRRCNKKISESDKKSASCLNYHINQCKAPCCKAIGKSEYYEMIEQVEDFLNGKQESILKELAEQMKIHSENMEYEKAAELRDKINAAKSLKEKQNIDIGKSDQDIIAFAKTESEAMVQVFFVRGGKMIGRDHFMLNGVENKDGSDILSAFVTQFYGGTPFVPKELILQMHIKEEEIISTWLSKEKGQKVAIIVPQKGEKLNLIKLAEKNAVITLEQFGKQLKREKERTEGAVKEISEAMGIDKYFERIEAYDISNIQGFESVGSMVVFENGKAKRSDYRKFKIRSVAGSNDYASMEEVLQRRFDRYSREMTNGDENKFSKLPDLILVDGGKAHANMAREVLDSLNLDILVCGMVKDARHRTRGLFYRGNEVHLPHTKEGFKLIVRIQDEAHRFALDYHRKLRKNEQVKSVLDDIKGVGSVRRKALIKHFGDIDKIRGATADELKKAPGISKSVALEIYKFFH